MPLTRKLSDLFITGRELEIDDGHGAVKVYIRKISPVDAQAAYRAANAAKAVALTAKTDPDDLTFQIVRERTEKMQKDEIVEQLVELEVQKKRLIIEAELEAEEEWSKDDYIQGLHDAWEGGLKKKHFTDPDEETKHVFDEMKRFDAELEKRVERERKSVEKDISSLSAQKVRDRFFDEQFERHAEVAWITEYRKHELFHAVRDPDNHDERLFGSPDEIDGISTKLIELLRETYKDLEVDGLEGKG
jgi:hypothetical protein